MLDEEPVINNAENMNFTLGGVITIQLVSEVIYSPRQPLLFWRFAFQGT